MSRIIIYKRPNGHQPALDFRRKLDRTVRSDLDGKISRLKTHGLKTLINTPSVVWLGPKALYELRNRRLGWRMAFYHDTDQDAYVLLCGWKKQKDLQREDVAQARSYLEEYLGSRSQQNGDL